MLKRRDFLRHTALGSAVAIGVPGADAFGAETGTSTSAAQSGLRIEETSVAELQQGMASGRFSCEQIATAELS